MLSAGILTPAELAARSKGKFTRQTAARWLKMDRAELSGELLCVLAELVNARMWWLVTGKGGAGREHVVRALEVLDRLDEAQRERWLKSGERMGR